MGGCLHLVGPSSHKNVIHPAWESLPVKLRFLWLHAVAPAYLGRL